MVQYILWLQIPMDNIVFVYVVDALTYLSDYYLSQVLLYWLVFLQEIIQLPRTAGLQDQVYMRLVAEECVQFCYVWVVQEHLDFYLPDQLSLKYLVQALFFNLLQCADEPTFPMPTLK